MQHDSALVDALVILVEAGAPLLGGLCNDSGELSDGLDIDLVP